MQAADHRKTTPPAASVTGESDPADNVYVDQLIDPELVSELFDAELREEEAEPQGRRFLSLEYQHYRQERDPLDDKENGILLNWRRETLNYGEFDLAATVREADQESFDDNSGNVQFTLHQFGFALNENWIMDNTAGVHRSNADSLVSSSFRLNLPSSLVLGARSRIADSKSGIDLSAGRIGRLSPSQIQGFDTENGDLLAVGYNRKLKQNWRVAAHALHVEDVEDVSDHQSVASALEYLTSDEQQRYQAHLLVDSKGQNGVWLDGDSRINRWRHRYGVFRLEPEMLWADTAVTNDQQGGYIRSETQALRFTLTTGLDFTDTNIDNSSTRADNYLYNGFMDGSWRWSHKTTLGSNLTVRGSEPRDDVKENEIRNYLASGYVSHGFPIGNSRLQLTASRLEQGNSTGDGYGIIWDQDWNLRRNLSLSSTLSHENETRLNDEEGRNTAALLVRHQISSRLNWDADMSYVRVDRQQRDIQNNLFASAAMNWRFLPDWDASLRVTFNRFDSEFEGFGTDISDEEKTLLLSIRYRKSSGRAFVVAGQKADALGYGEITGQVFYDENGDGLRQAGERVARNIVVYLDGRHVSLTDANGRFQFEQVPAGTHELTLAVEDLPLPWGLLDESPRRVKVETRGRSEFDFALQRIDQ